MRKFAMITGLGCLTLATMANAAEPSAEAHVLAQELAGQGMLATLLPMLFKKETEEMVADTAGLTDAEKAELRATASEIFAAGSTRLMEAQGRIYAEKLTLEDLSAMVAFNRSKAAENYKAIQPEVIAGTMEVMDGVDFKGETLAAFCKKTGKGCKAAQ